jgi:hypothetical protein
MSQTTEPTPPRCATCRHWETWAYWAPGYEGKRKCDRLSAHLSLDAGTHAVTGPDFGCTLHELKEE